MEPLNNLSAILRRLAMVLSLLIMLAATVWLAIIWPEIPDAVPSHFSADGSPDSYGGKLSLLAPLILGWVAVILFVVLEFFPQYWNIPQKSNGFRVSFGKPTGSNNGAQVTPGAQASMRSLMAVDRLAIAALFAVITICSAKGMALPTGVFAVIIIVMLASSVFFSVQASRRNSK